MTDVNSTPPSSRVIPIVINSKQYRLSFSIIAMAALQDHWQLADIDAVAKKMQTMGKSGVRDIMVIFWASLQRFHPEVTLDEASQLADDAGFAEITGALQKSYRGSTPLAGGKSAQPTKGKPHRARGR